MQEVGETGLRGMLMRCSAAGYKAGGGRGRASEYGWLPELGKDKETDSS